ncbi:MAG: glycosyltransferase family 2 protein [Hyphomonas sp.]
MITDNSVPVSVVVATKGRAAECAVLLRWLQRQTYQPVAVTLIGVETRDLPVIDGKMDFAVARLLSESAGSTFQRNVGLDWLLTHEYLADDRGFVIFMDDDFRPADDWIECAVEAFGSHPDVVGLTGWVLADGVKGEGLSDADAKAFVEGRLKAEPHWTNQTDMFEILSGYGCNMAFRSTAARELRFDEALPLYGWQEDTDYTGQAVRFGRMVIARRCRGVHLGSKRGRTSGVRFGYSQIANPLRIADRGNMNRKRALKFVCRALAGNVVNTLRRRPDVDYFGRLRGNMIAVGDLLRRRCRPARILELDA